MASRPDAPTGEFESVLAELRRRASPAYRQGLKRFAIPVEDVRGATTIDRGNRRRFAQLRQECGQP